ncbi:MAG TPA: dihydrofolate reductase [Clostridia bacterium]
MQEWIIIASADINWGIGCKDRLLARVSEDMKFVSEKTKGKVIVMGRKTLESFPSGKPLPDRLNVVLTRNIKYSIEGALVVHSIEELMEALKDYKGEIYVFGGGSIYRQLMPYCSRAYITRFRHEFTADTYLPRFDKLNEWELVYSGEWMTSKTGICYKFTEYKRVPNVNK